MEGGSQAQDHGQPILAKIGYSVSSTFATGNVAYICTVMFFNLDTKSFVWFSKSLIKVSKNKTNFAFLATFTSYNKIIKPLNIMQKCLYQLYVFWPCWGSNKGNIQIIIIRDVCRLIDLIVTDVPFSKGLNCRMISVSVWNEQQFQL